MKLTHTLLAVLLALPALAKDEKTDDKKPPKKSPVEQMLEKAEQKAAAGQTEAAASLLRDAAAMPNAGPEPHLRLGRMLESGAQLDTAIEAFKAAAAAGTGPAKGEALGRLALLQELRVMDDPNATAEQAAAADAE